MKKVVDLKNILMKGRSDIVRDIRKCVRENFGDRIVLTGIKDDSVLDSLTRTSSYGIPIEDIGCNSGLDILDYAMSSIVVYDKDCLDHSPNGDYLINNPRDAVKGFLKLGY